MYSDARRSSTVATSAAAPFRISKQPTEVELVAKYFRALSDPTRVRILELVADGERSVGEIVEALGQAQPNVSNHLACLRWCGFVESRREHRTVYYRVADERIEQLLELGRALLADNEEHVAACRRIDGRAS
jgi:DNA-binding transcriptional ArsR family regulator